jgi:hypothetical protein
MKPNPKVIAFSIIAIGFIILTFLINWLFIIGAVILMYLSQKELMKKKQDEIKIKNFQSQQELKK